MSLAVSVGAVPPVKFVMVVLLRLVPVEIARSPPFKVSLTVGMAVPAALRHTRKPAVPASTVTVHAVTVHPKGIGDVYIRLAPTVVPAVRAEPPPLNTAPIECVTVLPELSCCVQVLVL